MKPQIPMETYKCRPVKVFNNGWILLLFSAMIVFCGVMTWQLFPTPRAEKAKIVVLNEQQFKQLQRKYGAYNTRAVVYEADGKAYFYNKKNEKVFIK